MVSFRLVCNVALQQIRQFSCSRKLMDISTVAVIGSGIMGSGIAQVSATAGFHVLIVDQSDEILNKAKKNIEASLSRVAKKKFADDKSKAESFITNIMKNIEVNTSVADAVKEADLCIEAITENLDLKIKMFETMDKNARKSAILASNTSSLPLAKISQILKQPENFGGLHFFNPVPVMKLVEVIHTKNTSKETIDSMVKFCEKLGKNPVHSKDTPGFIVNRLLVPYCMEAIRLAERGDASMKDIDVAMKLGAGYPMGPFELFDFIGLDTCKFIIDGWHADEPNQPLFNPSPLLDKMVKEGKLGHKTGEGFYKYK
ncbi:putative 3-hydroxyacyl-CoA dehydrogenase [Trichinella nativa]|uniref:Hydroxyacyl-coenzyme A dehydrogenase, mitochondrial n=1 Tax=Trichinella nativa TaxID=6335 RepID=A0A0V1LEM6_9BILA|nr:putative 3-hydroxyacyl-CoA dehydrogenase [Trichinella nativa]